LSKPPRTDYEALAPEYDADRERFEIPADDVIAGRRGQSLTVLDVGCGTGLWLRAQSRYFPQERVRWTGLDPSPGMLAEAAHKGIPARLVRARAERLPFADASFDYVFTAYTYHHFEDKLAAFDEVARIIKAGGVFRIRHMDSFNKQDWWIYRFFPPTREIDAQRFWRTEALAEAITERGFEVDCVLNKEADTSTKADVVEVAERRVTSQLAVLDDASYEEGLRRLRALPDDATFETSRGSSLTLTATKRS
jgi:ubiquinone/menaquinone biosynthesis C-methylase UbiE